jgi:mannan endo-1,4-beta-mannosidase
VDKYNLPALDCSYGKASDNDVTAWYANPESVFDFDIRIAHILEHSNPLIEGAPQWKDLSDHIFSFNIQNEGQGHLDNNTAPVPEWWCDRAKSMREIMGHSDVLVSTGESFLTKSGALFSTS